MITVGRSEYMHDCDKCQEPATKLHPVVVLQTHRTPLGHKREQFHSIALHLDCLQQLTNEAEGIVNK